MDSVTRRDVLRVSRSKSLVSPACPGSFFFLLKPDLLIAEEAAYSSFYTPADYPITKVLREPIYVEVNILERSDPNIVLNLEHCWATSNPNPNSLPQWDILVDG